MTEKIYTPRGISELAIFCETEEQANDLEEQVKKLIAKREDQVRKETVEEMLHWFVDESKRDENPWDYETLKGRYLSNERKAE